MAKRLKWTREMWAIVDVNGEFVLRNDNRCPKVAISKTGYFELKEAGENFIRVRATIEAIPPKKRSKSNG